LLLFLRDVSCCCHYLLPFRTGEYLLLYLRLSVDAAGSSVVPINAISQSIAATAAAAAGFIHNT
jgi:hypothetical protein